MTLGSFVLCFFDKNLDAGSGHQYDHCFSRITVFSLGNWGGGGTPYNGLYGETPTAKGVPFQDSGIYICKDFTTYNFPKMREICHLSL